VAEVEQRLGPIDVLVCNAGCRSDCSSSTSRNGVGLDRGYEPEGQLPRRSGGGCANEGAGRGKIINVSSEAAGFPAQRMTAYCVSKPA